VALKPLKQTDHLDTQQLAAIPDVQSARSNRCGHALSCYKDLSDRFHVNAEQGDKTGCLNHSAIPPFRHSIIPPLREYSTDRRRRAEYELLGFTTDSHPMHLHAADLARFRITRSTELADHVGESVLCCGMLTTSKPISTITEEPMEFATFDDGYGLIETVLFPRVFRERGHVLFDQGPFIFRGKVDEEFGAITVAITGIDRLERMLERAGRREGGRADRADKADQK